MHNEAYNKKMLLHLYVFHFKKVKKNTSLFIRKFFVLGQQNMWTMSHAEG